MFEKIPSLISKSETVSHIGKIENVVGMSMERLPAADPVSGIS